MAQGEESCEAHIDMEMDDDDDGDDDDDDDDEYDDDDDELEMDNNDDEDGTISLLKPKVVAPKDTGEKIRYL